MTTSDIFNISRSKVRKDIINLFFANPAQKYYLRELAHSLDHSVGNVRRELLNMKQQGIFLLEHKGNLTFYSLNTKYHFFKELKSIVKKSIGWPEVIREALSDVDGIASAFVYGSFASGKETATSDIDLFIIGSVNPGKLLSNIRQAEKLLQREINYSVYSPEGLLKKKQSENSFIKDLALKPKVLIKGDSYGI